MAPFKMVNSLSPNERRAKIHDTKYLQDLLTVFMVLFLFSFSELIQADNIHPSPAAARCL